MAADNVPKMHAGVIETCVANLFGYRRHTIVPNVSWGLGFRHECDMLILDNKDRFTEVEIKISTADLMADFKKPHGHYSKIISRLYYAMPEELCEKHFGIIPPHCGLIAVKWEPPRKMTSWTGEVYHVSPGKYVATWWRQVRHDKNKEKPDEKTIRRFLELGCMRIWSLKERIEAYRERSHENGTPTGTKN